MLYQLPGGFTGQLPAPLVTYRLGLDLSEQRIDLAVIGGELRDHTPTVFPQG
ncbi:hypothetical protein [Streptomyces sp. BA2]|uniref:hypothetical protein n=1 Tax=Streptomyces sp. BA2 TaxID=436595 RepID=UPI003014C779